jgi:hypothetical protein
MPGRVRCMVLHLLNDIHVSLEANRGPSALEFQMPDPQRGVRRT